MLREALIDRFHHLIPVTAQLGGRAPSAEPSRSSARARSRRAKSGFVCPASVVAALLTSVCHSAISRCNSAVTRLSQSAPIVWVRSVTRLVLKACHSVRAPLSSFGSRFGDLGCWKLHNRQAKCTEDVCLVIAVRHGGIYGAAKGVRLGADNVHKDSVGNQFVELRLSTLGGGRRGNQVGKIVRTLTQIGGGAVDVGDVRHILARSPDGNG